MPARKEKKRERCRSFACRPLAPGYKTRLFLLKNVKKQKHLKGYFCFLVEELTGRSSEDFELSEEDHEMLHHWESMLQLKRIYILHKISNQITRKRVAYSLFFYFHQLNHSTDVIEREREKESPDWWRAVLFLLLLLLHWEKRRRSWVTNVFSPILLPDRPYGYRPTRLPRVGHDRSWLDSVHVVFSTISVLLLCCCCWRDSFRGGLPIGRRVEQAKQRWQQQASVLVSHDRAGQQQVDGTERWRRESKYTVQFENAIHLLLPVLPSRHPPPPHITTTGSSVAGPGVCKRERVACCTHPGWIITTLAHAHASAQE